jgi:hypothetical protein
MTIDTQARYASFRARALDTLINLQALNRCPLQEGEKPEEWVERNYRKLYPVKSNEEGG